MSDSPGKDATGGARLLPTEDLFQRAVEVIIYAPNHNMGRKVTAGRRPRHGKNVNTSSFTKADPTVLHFQVVAQRISLKPILVSITTSYPLTTYTLSLSLKAAHSVFSFPLVKIL